MTAASLDKPISARRTCRSRSGVMQLDVLNPEYIVMVLRDIDDGR